MAWGVLGVRFFGTTFLGGFLTFGFCGGFRVGGLLFLFFWTDRSMVHWKSCLSAWCTPALYSKRIIFQHTFPLPRESSPRTKPTKGTAKKPRKAKPKGETEKPLTPKRLSQQRPKKDRREYDQKRNQLPERREQHRLLAQDKRRKALALGLCRSCKNPSIPGQTRCPTCAEKHRLSRRLYDAKRRAMARQQVAQGQQAMLMT